MNGFMGANELTEIFRNIFLHIHIIVFCECRREAEMKNQMLSQILDQQARARCMCSL